jgi:hypothetical protein
MPVAPSLAVHSPKGIAPMTEAVTGWLEEHAPKASRRTQLLLASLLWTAIGVLLPSLGVVWILQRYGAVGLLFAAPCVLVGVMKGRYILDGMSSRTIVRVQERDEPSFFAGFFSARSWLLVAAMMATGQILRRTGLPHEWLGFVYVAIGSALLLSSRVLWRGWAVQGIA